MIAPLIPVHLALGGLSAEVVHVAGSKGKGSTTVLLARLLQNAGFRVGIFTSPALLEEREMIQINGEAIPLESLEVLKGKVLAVDPSLSEFEVLTLAAFAYFEQEACSHVVAECGWGGARDATNVLPKKALTILTHIELEHVGVLGNTLEEITREKCGITRPGVPLLTVASQSLPVLEEIKSLGLEPILAPSMEAGLHHPESVGLAWTAAQMLGLKPGAADLKSLAELQIPGRFERVLWQGHTLILDGAHTYDSVKYVRDKAQAYAVEHDLPEPFWALHFLKDKHVDLPSLFPFHRSVWIPLKDERAGQTPEGFAEASLGAFFEQLKGQPPQFIVFVGSFKLVGAVKKMLLHLK